MRFALVFWISITACNLASAGMMGHGMGGGMMDGNVTPATPPPKNADPALQRGYDLTRHFCSQCHVTPNPMQHNAAQWPQVVARMQNYMRQQKRPLPDADQHNLILNYLETGQRNP